MRTRSHLSSGTAPIFRCLAIAACLFGADSETLAQDLGQEWRALTAEESKIVFLAPNLDAQKARYLGSASEDYSHSLEVAFWSGLGRPPTKAVVVHVSAYSGYTLTTEGDPRDYVQSLDSFAGLDLAFGGLERYIGPLGFFRTRSFRYGDTDCLAFSVYWGLHKSHRPTAGSDRVMGYYCADLGQAVGKNFAESLVQGLGIKGYALPEKVP